MHPRSNRLFTLGIQVTGETVSGRTDKAYLHVFTRGWMLAVSLQTFRRRRYAEYFETLGIEWLRFEHQCGCKTIKAAAFLIAHLSCRGRISWSMPLPIGNSP